jgi:hypothetical protein
MPKEPRVVTFTIEEGVLHMRAGNLAPEARDQPEPGQRQVMIQRLIGEQLIQMWFCGDFDDAQQMAIIDYTLNGLARALHQTYVSRYTSEKPLPIDYIQWQRVSAGHWITHPGKS